MRNNLPPEAQNWVRDVEGRLTILEKRTTRALDDNTNALKGVNSLVTKLTSQVQAIAEITETLQEQQTELEAAQQTLQNQQSTLSNQQSQLASQQSQLTQAFDGLEQAQDDLEDQQTQILYLLDSQIMVSTRSDENTARPPSSEASACSVTFTPPSWASGCSVLVTAALSALASSSGGSVIANTSIGGVAGDNVIVRSEGQDEWGTVVGQRTFTPGASVTASIRWRRSNDAVSGAEVRMTALAVFTR